MMHTHAQYTRMMYEADEDQSPNIAAPLFSADPEKKERLTFANRGLVKGNTSY